MLIAGILMSILVVAQETMVSGSIRDKKSGETLIGVNITIKDKLAGTISDYNGKFSFATRSVPPFILVFSSVGYETFEMNITGSTNNLRVELQEKTIFGQEVVISASRVEENILQSSVSVEKLNIQDIRQMPAANFYDGLSQLKGVDMNIHSLTFRFPNTRGFNNENNYRLNQMVDGIDNISPGLSFAAGNLFGISQLDLESVELIVGASSALYGPGGMNGTLMMTSKNPFEYQGLSFNLQTGIMHVGAEYRDNISPMYDVSFRYAKSFKDKLAVKFVGSYLTATDWHAADYRDRTNVDDPELTRETNPGYDGVNVYGDDIIVPVNLQNLAPTISENVCLQQGLVPGTPEYQACYEQTLGIFPDQVVSRTGWKEKDLVDYGTENLRLNGAIHYRITDELEIIGDLKYSKGTSVYTAQNRFSIRDFDIYTGKLELKNPDYFIRAWGVLENSGATYDAGTAALLMNETWKPSADWYEDYIGAFTQNRLLGSDEQTSHDFARLVADNRDSKGNKLNPNEPAFPLAGSDEFNNILNDLRSRPLKSGGAMVVDKSRMWQVEGVYNFNRLIQLFELLVGVNHRIYSLNTEGTAFADKPGEPIMINQFGSFAQLSKNILGDHVKLTVSARYDKHEKFEGKFTPRFSFVYSIDNSKEHNFRGSYQTAFRFPSNADQWVDFPSAIFHALGGLPEVQNMYGFNTNPVYPMSGPNPVTDVPVVDDGPFTIPKFGPEKVTALEVGYKGLYFNKLLFVDAYIYRNNYSGFLARQLLVQNPFTPDEVRYQTVISTSDPVASLGWAVGGDFRLPRGFFVRGNIAYNALETKPSQEGLQTRFNTPDYRLNMSVGNRDFTKNIGFSLNWRWQNSFLWESDFGTGNIPAFSTVDAHVSYKLNPLKSIIKLGGSNILNNYYTTSFGAPQIGGLYYISWTFDSYLN
jgi:iron complex outermembrane recepter protein